MSAPGRVPRQRRAIYGAALAPAAIIVFELVLRLTGLVVVFDPFVEVEGKPGAPAGYRYLFNDRLPTIAVPAPAGVTRVIVIGESAVAGYPFQGAGFPEQASVMISRLAGSAGQYQIINLGVNGLNTDREREILRDALPAIKPDVVIIFAGNNEIFAREKIDDLSHPRLKAGIWWLRRHSRLWDLPGNAAGYFISRGLSMTLLLHIAHGRDTVGEWSNDAAAREHARELYIHHLRQMVELCRAHGATPVLCTPPANLRDWAPMKSVHTAGLGPEAVALVDRGIEDGRALTMAGRPVEAARVLARVTDADPDFAKGWFYRGRAEVLAGDTSEGARHLVRAVEQADFFQQTPPSWCEAVRALARETGTPLVDAEAGVWSRAVAGVPGFEWFVDGCHPTIEGYNLIARVLVHDLARQGVLPGEWAGATLPDEKKIVSDPGARKYLSNQYFNQALVLALLYGYPEYQEAALAYLDEAVAMGFSAGVAGPYQGFLAAMLGRPERAAEYLSRGRTANAGEFGATIGKKLGRVMIQDDPWLWVKKASAGELPELYPVGDVSPDRELTAAACSYRFAWDGASYKSAPP